MTEHNEWDNFIEGINGFTEDYFEILESRKDDFPQQREFDLLDNPDHTTSENK